jgi:hypothetical protein
MPPKKPKILTAWPNLNNWLRILISTISLDAAYDVDLYKLYGPHRGDESPCNDGIESLLMHELSFLPLTSHLNVLHLLGPENNPGTR